MIKDGAVEVSEWFRSQFARAAAHISAALGSIDPGDAWSNLLQGAKLVANQVIGSFVFAAKSISASWSSLGVAITGAIVDSMNAVIAAVENAVNKVSGAINSLTGMANLNFGASFPQIAPVDLGRIGNAYAGAGKYAAEAFGDAFKSLSHDYVGDIDAAIQKIRERANQEGIKHVFDHKSTDPGRNDGTLDQKLKASPKKDDEDAGAAKKDKQDDFQKKIAELEKQARAYDMEREAIGKSALEAEKAKAAFELLEAAKKANVPVTEELRGKVDKLAEAYANSKIGLDETKKKFDDFKSGVAEFGTDLKDAFSSAIIDGKRLGDVFDSLLKKFANRAFDKAFDGIFGALTSGLTPGAFGSIGKIFGFADGGLIQGPGGSRSDSIPVFASGGEIRGPGTGTSDSILAAVSNGEFVVKAEATAKFLPLLRAINSGHVPKFANGGIVGAPSLPAFNPIQSVGNTAGTVNISAPVTVNASGGTPEQNADLAKQTSAAIEQTMRGVVVSEIQRQLRPGNLLSSSYARGV